MQRTDKDATIRKAQSLANLIRKQVIVYPEPSLGEDAWDYMSLDSFKTDGEEVSELDIIVEPQ